MDRRESLLAAREVTQALGTAWVLPHHATITKLEITDESVTVVLDIYEVRETVRETRFIKHGVRLLNWTSSSDSYFGWKYTTMTAWDDDFKPFTEHKVGRIETPAEYMERRRWEGEVYRPGSDRSPMDSAYRVTLGHTTDAMTNYWNN